MSEISVSVADARAQFSKIAAMVNETGESVTVFRNSKPWVKITPVVDGYVDAIDHGLEKGFADFKSGHYIKGEEITTLFEELRKANDRADFNS